MVVLNQNVNVNRVVFPVFRILRPDFLHDRQGKCRDRIEHLYTQGVVRDAPCADSREISSMNTPQKQRTNDNTTGNGVQNTPVPSSSKPASNTTTQSRLHTGTVHTCKRVILLSFCPYDNATRLVRTKWPKPSQPTSRMPSNATTSI
jgi:hypothetical protein